jgi:RNA polymerase sigma-70 factor (sigma-E family)
MAAQREFEAFVATASPRLLRLATVLTGNRSDGEDLLQMAFLRVYRRWEDVSLSTDDPTAYMRRVLVNLHVDEQRRGGRRIKALRVLVPRSRGDVDDPADVVTGHIGALAMVQELPPRQRAVVVLRYFEDLSEKDVAELLGCALGTVKNLHHQAMQKLRHTHTPAGKIQEEVHG